MQRTRLERTQLRRSRPGKYPRPAAPRSAARAPFCREQRQQHVLQNKPSGARSRTSVPPMDAHTHALALWIIAATALQHQRDAAAVPTSN